MEETAAYCSACGTKLVAEKKAASKPKIAPISFEEEEKPAVKTISFEEEEPAPVKAPSFEEESPAAKVPQQGQQKSEHKFGFGRKKESDSRFRDGTEEILDLELEDALQEQPDSRFQSEPEPQPQTDSRFQSEPEPQSQSDMRFQSEPTPQPQSDSRFQSEPEPQPQSDMRFQSEPEPQSQSDSRFQSEPTPQSQSDSRFQSEPQPQQPVRESGPQFADFAQSQSSDYETRVQEQQSLQLGYQPPQQSQPEPVVEPEQPKGIKFYSGNSQGYFGYDGSSLERGRAGSAKAANNKPPKNKPAKTMPSNSQPAAQEQPEKEKKKGGSKSRIVLLIILLVILLGYGAWYAYQNYFPQKEYKSEIDVFVEMVSLQTDDYETWVNHMFPKRIADDFTEMEKAVCKDYGMDYAEYREKANKNFAEAIQSYYGDITEGRMLYVVRKERALLPSELSEISDKYKEMSKILGVTSQLLTTQNSGLDKQSETYAAYQNLVNDLAEIRFTEGYELDLMLFRNFKRGEITLTVVKSDGEWRVDYINSLTDSSETDNSL